MSDAKKCDRCGRLYGPYADDDDTKRKNIHGYITCAYCTKSNNSEVKISLVDYSHNTSIDLCNSCWEKFQHWWDWKNDIAPAKIFDEITKRQQEEQQ